MSRTLALIDTSPGVSIAATARPCLTAYLCPSCGHGRQEWLEMLHLERQPGESIIECSERLIIHAAAPRRTTPEMQIVLGYSGTAGRAVVHRLRHKYGV